MLQQEKKDLNIHKSEAQQIKNKYIVNVQYKQKKIIQDLNFCCK